jgi:transcriptional regulator with XRE-family HTH domain
MTKTNKVKSLNFNAVKFWRRIDARLAEMGKKRVWLSEVTSVNKSTINNWVAGERWPTVIALYYFSKVFNTTMSQLLIDSIE